MSTADKLNALVQTKADIKQALIDKGQNPTDVFSTYADDIRAIETGYNSNIIIDDNTAITGNIENFDFSKIDYQRTVTSYSLIYCNISSNKSLDFRSFNTSKITDSFTYFLYNISTSKSYWGIDVTGWNISSFTSLYEGTYETPRLTEIKGTETWDLSNITDIFHPFNGFCSKFTFKNIGINEQCTRCRFEFCTKWGTDYMDVINCRQTVIDTLVNYSFDRASANYLTCTINLHSTTKALLTEDEIAQITAKGYTIA